MVLAEKSMGLLKALMFMILIAIAVIAVAIAVPQRLIIPGGGQLDIFTYMGQRFSEFLGQQVGLGGKETAEWFCQRDLQDNIELCKMSPSQLSDYCKSSDEEKNGICLKPPDTMAKFCELGFAEREKKCSDQNDFNSACEEVNAKKDAKSTKDLPFCK